jgi:allophanate hydrolase
MPLHHQLSLRGAALVAVTETAPAYRLHALDTVPPKPGLVRGAEAGGSIAVEVYSLDTASFGSFVAEVPPPMAIGTVELIDGSWVSGFVCEPLALAGAPDMSHHGGWRAAVAAMQAAAR